jgi:hypothetical protein
MKTTLVLVAPSVAILAIAVGLVAGLYIAAWRGWGPLACLSTMFGSAAALALLAVLALPYVYPPGWIAAVPRGLPWKAGHAIVFGCGYQVHNGRVSADCTHKALLDWTLAHTPVADLLVQEAVFATARAQGWEPVPKAPNALRHPGYPGRTIRRFHRHDPRIDVSTAEAVFCALPLLEDRSSVLLVAVPEQLARVAYDAAKVAPEREWIVPLLPPLPFNPHSVQRQARSRAGYVRYELGARVWDIFRPAPHACRAPLD